MWLGDHWQSPFTTVATMAEANLQQYSKPSYMSAFGVQLSPSAATSLFLTFLQRF